MVFQDSLISIVKGLSKSWNIMLQHVLLKASSELEFSSFFCR
jgi:hypothetical protein